MRRESALARMFPSFRLLVAATFALVLALAAGLPLVARSPLPGGLINARAHLSPLNAIDPDATAPLRQAAVRAEELKRLLSVTAAPVRAEMTEPTDEDARAASSSAAPPDAPQTEVVTMAAPESAMPKEAAAEPAAPLAAQVAIPESEPSSAPPAAEKPTALAPAADDAVEITASIAAASTAATEPLSAPAAAGFAEPPQQDAAGGPDDDSSVKLAAIGPAAEVVARPSVDPVPWPKMRAEKRERRGGAKARGKRSDVKKQRARTQVARPAAAPRAAVARNLARRPVPRAAAQPQSAGWNGGFGVQTTYGKQTFGGFGAQ